MTMVYNHEMSKVVRWFFLALLFVAAITLDLVWWYRLKTFTNTALSPKVRDVLFAATWVLVSLAVVVCLRSFKKVRRFQTMPFARAIISCHTVGAAMLVTLVWFDSFKNIDSLNVAYSAGGYNDLKDGKLQTSAFVFTVLICSYVHAIVETAHHEAARVKDSRPLPPGYAYAYA